MAKRNRTNACAKGAHVAEELSAILGRFSDARSVLECAVRSLETWHDATTGTDQEAVTLRHGMGLIEAVYNDLDAAIPACSEPDGPRPAGE